MSLARCLGTDTLSFFCWTFFLVLLLETPLLPWAAGVLAGVYCLQLFLYTAASCCCWLLPAAAVATAGRKLVYSPGAAVAAGLL